MEEVRFQREEAGLSVLEPNGLRDVSGYVFGTGVLAGQKFETSAV